MFAVNLTILNRPRQAYVCLFHACYLTRWTCIKVKGCFLAIFIQHTTSLMYLRLLCRWFNPISTVYLNKFFLCNTFVKHIYRSIVKTSCAITYATVCCYLNKTSHCSVYTIAYNYFHQPTFDNMWTSGRAISVSIKFI